MFVDTAEQFNTGLKPKAAEWRWSNKMVERPWWPQIILTKIKAFRGLYGSFLCHFRGVFSKKPKILPKKKEIKGYLTTILLIMRMELALLKASY